MSVHRDDVAGQLGGVELVSRHLTWVVANKVAAIGEVRPEVTKLYFDGGGSIDMCGPADLWRKELANARG